MVSRQPKRFIIQMDEFILEETSSRTRKVTKMTQNMILHKMCDLRHFSG